MTVLTILFFLVSASVFSQTLPSWFIPLRDAIYEQQLTADQIVPIYRQAAESARTSLTGAEQAVMLSRCEYMMGRAYQYEDRKNEAIRHYDEGIKYAERALEIRESDAAWVMYAENISQSCVVRPASYAVANGLRVERYAKSAIALNRRNGAAHFLVAARWVYAPTPFHNYNRGIEMLNVIINESHLEKDDLFNVYSALGYAYMQRRNKEQARTWLQESLKIYPTNKYVRSLLDTL